MSHKCGTILTQVHSFEVRLVLEFCDLGDLRDVLDQVRREGGGSGYGVYLGYGVRYGVYSGGESR